MKASVYFILFYLFIGQAWAEDYSRTFDDYSFQPNNPLKETKDCFETAKLKLSEGEFFNQF